MGSQHYVSEDIEAIFLTLCHGDQELRVLLRPRYEGPAALRGSILAAFVDRGSFEDYMEQPENFSRQNYFAVPPLQVTAAEFAAWMARAGLAC